MCGLKPAPTSEARAKAEARTTAKASTEAGPSAALGMTNKDEVTTEGGGSKQY